MRETRLLCRAVRLLLHEEFSSSQVVPSSQTLERRVLVEQHKCKRFAQVVYRQFIRVVVALQNHR